jgi:hypothetical protein
MTQMVSDIEHIPPDRGMREVWRAAIASNVLMACIIIALMWLKGMPPVIIGGALAGSLVVLNPVLYLSYRYHERDLLDTLSFRVELDKRDFGADTDLYKSIIRQVEAYLNNNRIGCSHSFDGFRFGGMTLPYSKVLSLESIGAKLKVRRDKGGRTKAMALVIIGPVSGGNEAVLRKLMGELRSELERFMKEERSTKPDAP